MTRLIHWQGIDEWRAEAVRIKLLDDGVRAIGTQIGVDPEPYRLDYTLDVPADWTTCCLQAHAIGDGWERRLTLTHDGAGGWAGEGVDPAELTEARDCDLGFSPLTNLMPVRRHALHERPGSADFVTAWVSVPDLAVHASPQRYEHVRPGVVRFFDDGVFDGFSAELELDADGLALVYPELARRVTPAPLPRR